MEDLEAWMKLVAWAGYDYMKFMVVELQQDLEEREMLRSTAEVAFGGPRVPPHNRANSFKFGRIKLTVWPVVESTSALALKNYEKTTTKPARRRSWSSYWRCLGSRLRTTSWCGTTWLESWSVGW